VILHSCDLRRFLDVVIVPYVSYISTFSFNYSTPCFEGFLLSVHLLLSFCILFMFYLSCIVLLRILKTNTLDSQKFIYSSKEILTKLYGESVFSTQYCQIKYYRNDRFAIKYFQDGYIYVLI
jgi:hypothetical protein